MQSPRLREYLRAYHSRYPGVTERSMLALARGANGASSYDLLADQLAAHVPQHGSILEAACGSGALLAALRERRHDVALTGVDLSTEEIELARTRVPDARFYEGDVMRELPDGKFDAIATHLALFLMGRASDALQWFGASLSPQGIFAGVVEDVASPHRRFFEMVTRGANAGATALEDGILDGAVDDTLVKDAAAVFAAAGFDLLVDRAIEMRSATSGHSAAVPLIAYAYPFGLLDDAQRKLLEADVTAELATEPAFVFPLRLLVARRR